MKKMTAYLAVPHEMDAASARFLREEFEPALARVRVDAVDCRLQRSVLEATVSTLLGDKGIRWEELSREGLDSKLAVHVGCLARGADVVILYLKGAPKRSDVLWEASLAARQGTFTLAFLDAEYSGSPGRPNSHPCEDLADDVRHLGGIVVRTMDEMLVAMTEPRIEFALRQQRAELVA